MKPAPKKMSERITGKSFQYRYCIRMTDENASPIFIHPSKKNPFHRQETCGVKYTSGSDIPYMNFLGPALNSAVVELMGSFTSNFDYSLLYFRISWFIRNQYFRSCAAFFFLAFELQARQLPLCFICLLQSIQWYLLPPIL